MNTIATRIILTAWGFAVAGAATYLGVSVVRDFQTDAAARRVRRARHELALLPPASPSAPKLVVPEAAA